MTITNTFGQGIFNGSLKKHRHFMWLLCFFSSTTIFAQNSITIKGKIVDENNLSAIGATVLQKGTTNGTATDENGLYSLTVPVGSTIEISMLSFETQTILVDGQKTEYNIQIQPAVSVLNEVVVTGYGTQRKMDVTGAVSRVNLEKLENAPNTNIGQYLQGTVPGLNVGLSTFAGGTPPISIRGRVTLNGNQNVLIILDGIQYNQSLSSINPDDISSIDVLKDASATAVYGAQAANGVILITTRKGRAGQAPRVALSSSYSTLTPTVGLKPQNRAQFLTSIQDAFWNEAYLGPDYTQINPAFKIASKVDASMALPGRTDVLPNDYDWWTNATKTGGISETNLSVSGGTEKLSYLLSGSLVDQKGYIINDIFKRKSLRANLEIQPFNFWKVGIQSSGAFVNQDGAEPTMGIITITSPLLVPFDPAGNLIPSPTNTVVGNPFLTYYVDDRDRHNYFFANIYSDLEVPFIKGLTYRINYGNNYRASNHFFSSAYGAGLTGQAYKESQEYADYTFDNILNYNKKIGMHEFGLTALYGAIERNFNRTFAEGTTFARLTLGYNNIQSAANRNITTNGYGEALSYQMGRLNYKFNDKYLLTATVRRDGFSGFAQNFKYAIFPSVGLGWVVSNEGFMKTIPAFEFLKLRLTYGVIGNQTNRYASLSQVGTNSAYVYGDGAGTSFGQQVNTLSNPNLKWERTEGLNLGVDYTVFAGKLSGNFEYYINNTHDLLFDVTIPSITGFNSISTNVGNIHNTGFEAGITYEFIRHKDFNWSTTFNFWQNANRITSLTGIDANKDGKEDDLVSSGLFIDRSIQSIYDYQAGPIYQLNQDRLPGFQVGTLSVVDQNKDGKIDANDRAFLGKQEPAYRLSLFNNVSYKGLSFSFFLNGIQGGKNGYLGNAIRGYFRDDNSLRNNELTAVEYWSPRTPNAKFPRNVSGSRSSVDPNLWESRSFIRLQDVSLGYSLPTNLISKIKAQAINVYVSGKNLATWTKWEGWDPEGLNADGAVQGLILNGRPVLKGITIGARVTY